MKKFYLFALVILSFHALPVGDLSAADQPIERTREAIWALLTRSNVPLFVGGAQAELTTRSTSRG